MIVGIILAAGGASRFGGLKQLAELDGRPLIEHSVEAMRAVSAVERILVVLGAQGEAIRDAADLAGTEVVIAADWEEGIAASLRAGIAAAAETEADAVVVTLADQPRIGPRAIAAVLAHLDDPAPAVRATYRGRPGHPVLIRRSLFDHVLQLRGDQGARDLLDAHGARDIECDDLAGSDDVDTPADLEALREPL